MPRRVYSPDEKVDALQSLAKNAGDITSTSHQTGIPQRTLYTWRMEEWDQQRQRRQSQPLPPPIEFQKFEDTTEFFEDIRLQMFRILERIPADLSHLPPYIQRDRHLARLGALDIIIKLTKILGIPEDDEIEYIYEDFTEESKPESKVMHTNIHVPPPTYFLDDDPTTHPSYGAPN